MRKNIFTKLNVSTIINKKIDLSSNDLKRQKNIISKLNLKKLPFDIPTDRICDLNLEMPDIQGLS